MPLRPGAANNFPFLNRRPIFRRAAIRSAIALLGLAAIVVSQWSQITELTVGNQRPVLVQAIVTGVLTGGVLGLVSIGLTLIFGVLHIINFAQGALITLGMYTSYVVVETTGLDVYLTLPVILVVLFIVGAAVHKAILSPLMGRPVEAGLIATLGLSIVIENALRLGFGSTPRSIELGYAYSPIDLGVFEIGVPIRIFGSVVLLPQLIAFLGSLILVSALFVVLRMTQLGTAIRSVSDNPVGASLVGINVNRIYMLTFGVGCACAGAAGVLLLPSQSLDPATGTPLGIIAFVVVVLGGLGSVPGALLGGLVIGLTQEVGAAVFPDQNKLLPVFVVFLLVLFLRPQGLLGKGAE